MPQLVLTGPGRPAKWSNHPPNDVAGGRRAPPTRLLDDVGRDRVRGATAAGHPRTHIFRKLSTDPHVRWGCTFGLAPGGALRSRTRGEQTPWRTCVHLSSVPTSRRETIPRNSRPCPRDASITLRAHRRGRNRGVSGARAYAVTRLKPTTMASLGRATRCLLRRYVRARRNGGGELLPGCPLRGAQRPLPPSRAGPCAQRGVRSPKPPRRRRLHLDGSQRSCDL